MSHPIVSVLAIAMLLQGTISHAQELPPTLPDPAKGAKQKNGYVHCKFVTRAKTKAGVEVDVPYEADYWLSPEYAAESKRRFPVIYVLQNMDVPRKEMSEMFRKGQFPPFLVVHINGIHAPLNKGENGVWSESQGPAGKIFRTELTQWVDKHFRTVPGPKGRVLIGCSKGGGRALHLGIHYPDIFSAAVSADGAIGLYDTGNNDGDYYTKNKMTLVDAIQRNGEATRNLSALLLLGSMFGAGGEKDAHLQRLKSAGMTALDFQDCRHFGHSCQGMTNDRFPEVMATFYNGIGAFAPWLPTVSHRTGVYAAPFDATVKLPHEGWTIRYTLDGSDPHKGGDTTVGPVRITKSCWLRAIGIAPDGKQQSRENLIRYTVQAPWPATTPGNEPGLLLRAYDLATGGATPVQDCVDKIQKGMAKPLAEAVAPRLGETADPIVKVAAKTKFFVYTGTITLPETGVYEFDVTDCNGVYFPQKGLPWKEVGRAFAGGVGVVQVPLEKGAHPILIHQGNKSSKTVELRARRSSNEEFATVPAEWYRH